MRSWLLVLAVFSACATTPEQPPRPLPPPPAHHSSIDAVLAYRGELELTGDQVGQLQTLDAKLEQDNASIRAELRSHEHPEESGPPSGPASTNTMAGQQAMGARGAPRGGMGRGGPGGMGGSGLGGGGRGSARDPERRARIEAALQRLDDNDTGAYLAAEGVLSEAQRGRAREIASRYRAELMDFRQALRERVSRQ